MLIESGNPALLGFVLSVSIALPGTKPEATGSTSRGGKASGPWTVPGERLCSHGF